MQRPGAGLDLNFWKLEFVFRLCVELGDGLHGGVTAVPVRSAGAQAPHEMLGPLLQITLPPQTMNTK